MSTYYVLCPADADTKGKELPTKMSVIWCREAWQGQLLWELSEGKDGFCLGNLGMSSGSR